MRGSHEDRGLGDQLPGSIPARAGKPPCRSSTTAGPRVYPRPCGEALGGTFAYTYVRGLSPPVRGSRSVTLYYLRSVGSIPARAGKPCCPRSCRCSRWVYPRPCGEAPPPAASALIVPGLSPPVRGSPADITRLRRGLGSIPARAGKPLATGAVITAKLVYPRPCGEALVAPLVLWPIPGLSPPVRGSRHGLWSLR